MTNDVQWTPPEGWECPKCKAAREANVQRVQAHRARSKNAAAPPKAKKAAKPSKPKPAEPLVQRAAIQQPVPRLDAPQIQVGPITPAIGSRLKQPKKAKG